MRPGGGGAEYFKTNFGSIHFLGWSQRNHKVGPSPAKSQKSAFLAQKWHQFFFFANLTKNELFFHHLAPLLVNTFFSKLKLKIWIFFLRGDKNYPQKDQAKIDLKILPTDISEKSESFISLLWTVWKLWPFEVSGGTERPPPSLLGLTGFVLVCPCVCPLLFSKIMFDPVKTAPWLCLAQHRPLQSSYIFWPHKIK